MAADETDREEGARHPRASRRLIGHEGAERTLLDAYHSGRLAHAWLLCGPRGIGKSTLAYRFARHVLADMPQGSGGLFAADPGGEEQASLDMTADHPVFRRVLAGGHADLIAVERGYDEKAKRLRTEIVVDDIRRLHHFFSMTPSESMWRVAIVDSADEMNQNAANALLKVLEEPPVRGLLLVIAHAPGGLLPTIRSRCRRLVLKPLTDAEVEEVVSETLPDIPPEERQILARLAKGSPGRAVDLAELGGAELFRVMSGLLGGLPELDIGVLHAFADSLSGRQGDAAFRAFSMFLDEWLQHIVLFSVTGGESPTHRFVLSGEEGVARRLAACRSPSAWLDAREELLGFLRRGDVLNLDRRQMIIGALSKLQVLCQPN